MKMSSQIRAVRICLLGLIGLVASLAYGGEEPTYRRWAIISATPAEATGIPELLTAELSGLPGFELVERDRVAAATQELELAAAFGSQAADLRLRLGRRLKADALIFLSIEQLENKPCLKMVISECSYGARLRVEYFPYHPQKSESLVVRSRDSVEQVRRDYASGVKRVIGLSTFLSKNLDHKFDHLQTEYAHLVEAALTRQPGLALIEIEEAQAISRELDADQDRARTRELPLLVEGDFEMVAVEGRTRPDVLLVIRLQSGAAGKPRTIENRGSMSETARFLRENVPQAILSEAKQSPQLISTQQQLRWLSERADQFQRDGAWRHEVALREAALLVEPDNLEQELKLIDACHNIMLTELYEVPDDQQSDQNPLFQAAVEARVAALEQGLEHLAQLIRDERLEATQALELWSKLRAAHLELTIPNGRPREEPHFPRLGHQRLARAEDLEDRFVAGTAPLILKLPLKLHPPDSDPRLIKFRSIFVEKWCQAVLDATFDRCDRGYRTKDDLDRFVSVYRKLIPDDYWHSVSHSPTLAIYPHQRANHWNGEEFYDARRPVGEDAITMADWRAFLEQLKKSGHRGAALTGEYTLGFLLRSDVSFAQMRKENPPTDELRHFLVELEALIADWQKTPWVTLPRPDGSELRSARDPGLLVINIKNLIDPPKSEPSDIRTMEPPNWETVTIGRITFEPLIVHGDARGDLEVPFRCTHILAGPALDIYWDDSSVWYMRKPGFCQMVAHGHDIIQDDVKWDGNLLWVAIRQSGLWLFDAEGKLRSRINADSGLPPCDNGIRLHVVGPNKICAIGSFGEHGRGWCAMITPKEQASGYKVDVFHRATEVQSDSQKPDSTQLVFQPYNILELDLGKGQERMLAITRLSQKHYYRFTHRLLVNLETNEVSLAPESLNETKFFHGIEVPRPWDGDLAWRRLLNDKRLESEAFYYRGAIYCFYSGWRRFNPNAAGTEVLIPQGRISSTSQYNQMYEAGETAHYGLTLWSSTYREYPHFYRLTIDETDAKAALPQ